ncbi:MAG TPA: glutaredoxin domain-containing protein [Candidatus Omnitrophota bacterium]|nr:glutaredoxin domain-containing protein [Candidatus Omnitrophota bacterium]
MANVKVYSTPTCPYCVRLKAYLDSKGVQYENFDVSSDENKLQEMISISGQMGVPVIEIDSKDVVIGFDKEQIDILLKL